MKSALNVPELRDEAAAFAYVEAKLWPDGPTCPHCGVMGEASRSTGKTTRMGLWNCRACRKPFTVRIGTIFEDSHVPLHIWLQVMYLVCSSKKGVSTRQIQRTIGGSMKTAWFLGHRIREAMADDTAIMGGGGGVIEADETFLGAAPNLFVNKKGWVGGSGEKKILTVVERKGRARSTSLDSLGKDEIVRGMDVADRDSILSTDEAHHLQPHRQGVPRPHDRAPQQGRVRLGRRALQHRRGLLLDLRAWDAGHLSALLREARSAVSG